MSELERKRIGDKLETTAGEVKHWSDEMKTLKDDVRRQVEEQHLCIKQEQAAHLDEVEALRQEVRVLRQVGEGVKGDVRDVWAKIEVLRHSLEGVDKAVQETAAQSLLREEYSLEKADNQRNQHMLWDYINRLER